ncbi:unnamed protein product [Hapterophycus canaliculatus]
MRNLLLLVVSLIVSVGVGTLADECHNICADVKKGVSFKSACSAFRSSLPKPKVSSRCQSGFKEAVDMNCYDACVNGGRLQPFISEHRLDEACKSALKETPRPLCHDACVRGYRSGIKDMSSLLLKRMAEIAPTVLTALKEDTLARQVAQSAHADAPADLQEAGLTKPDASAEAEIVAPSQRDNWVAHKQIPGAEGRKAADKGAAETRKHEEIQGISAKVGEPHEAHPDGKEPVAKIEDTNVEVLGDADGELSMPVGDEVKQHLQGVETRDGTNQDEDINMWIEHEEQVLLSLPITVDNVQKELAILEGDDPMEAVLEFCRDNMPEEGAACADELIRVVKDEISPGLAREE